MKPQRAPASDAGQRRRAGSRSTRARRPGDAHGDRAERAHQELALGADVEQAGLEAEGDRQAAEDQRRGRDERSDDRIEAADRALDRAPVGRRAAAAESNWPARPARRGQDHERADDQRQHDRDQRQARAPRCAASRAASTPVAARSMRASCRRPRPCRRCASRRRSPSAGRPRSCRPSGHRRSATIWPRYITAIRSDSSRTSSSSAETSSIAVPASRFAIAWRWMNSMLPTSRPRVGWSRTSSFSSPVELPGDDDLLLVAAGQGAGGARRPTASGRRTRAIRRRRASSIAPSSRRIPRANGGR